MPRPMRSWNEPLQQATAILMLLGSGIKLFGDLPADMDLRPLSAKAFPFGFVQSHYVVCQKA